MSGRGAAIVAALALLALACGGGGDGGEAGADAPGEGPEGVAMPPSANAPRASLPGHVPDTVRPDPDTLVADPVDSLGLAPPAGRRRAAEELDLATIVAAYREYYREEYVEQGSDVRGGVDPRLVEDAKRRVALDWGYVEVGAWSDLLSDMTADQRTVLANRIAAANETLARELHGTAPPTP